MYFRINPVVFIILISSMVGTFFQTAVAQLTQNATMPFRRNLVNGTMGYGPYSLRKIDNELFYEENSFKKFVRCITAKSESSADPCVKKLLISTMSVSNDTAQFRQVQFGEACNSNCAQNYLRSMGAISNQCIQEIDASIAGRNYTAAVLEKKQSAATRIGNALVSFIRESECVRESTGSRELCSLRFLQFTSENKLWIKAPNPTSDFSFISLGGFKTIFTALNLTALNKLNKTSICSSCNLQFLQNSERLYSTQIIESIRQSQSPRAFNRSLIAHEEILQSVNLICGPNSIRSNLPRIVNNNASVITQDAIYSLPIRSSSASSRVRLFMSFVPLLFSLF